MGVFQSTMNEVKEEYFIGRFDHIHVHQQKDWDCGIACFLMAQVPMSETQTYPFLPHYRPSPFPPPYHLTEMVWQRYVYLIRKSIFTCIL